MGGWKGYKDGRGDLYSEYILLRTLRAQAPKILCMRFYGLGGICSIQSLSRPAADLMQHGLPRQTLAR